MSSTGLVFSGGGGKGAYQIGVWKYLHEYGIDRHISAVSGTSVGALNAALFAGSSYEEAEKIWIGIKNNQILMPRKDKLKAIVGFLVKYGVSESLAFGIVASWRDAYFFSREGLQSIIDKAVDFDAIRKGVKPCFATCFNLSKASVQRFLLNDFDNEMANTILLGSSAIPVIFGVETINEEKYIDGGCPGIGDNVPIEPLYRLGIETIIVIHLDQTKIIDKEKYPGARIIEIIPQRDLGGIFTGMLDFSSEGAKWRIQQGYNDAGRVFSDMTRFAVEGRKYRQRMEDAITSMDFFEQERSAFFKIEKDLKDRKKQDGFDELYKELMNGRKNEIRQS